MSLFDRILIGLAAVGTGVALSTWVPYFLVQNVAAKQKERISRLRGEVTQAQEILANLPDPSAVALGSPPAAKTLAGQTESLGEALSASSFSRPAPFPFVPPIGVGREPVEKVNRILSDPEVRDSYLEVGERLADLKDLFSYHARVMQALANVLDYNPGLDFQSFDLQSEDTRSRLEAMKTGLEKARIRLKEAEKASDDPALAQIQDAVSVLESDRDRLVAEGDLARFKRVFRQKQEEIRANRGAFWSQEKEAAARTLPVLLEILTDLKSRWSF